MQISDKGINLIKSFEGLRLNSYKAIPTEKYYTIGYGHYASDLKADTKITEPIAEIILKSDLRKYEELVNSKKLNLTQNQFDALVSFTFNCGVGCLNTLIKNRNIVQIGEALPLYNKAGGKVLAGLVRRREAEKNLFFEV